MDKKKDLPIFIEYWWLAIRKSASTTGKKVDVRSRLKDAALFFGILIILAIGILAKWIPDAVIQALKGDALSSLRLAIFVLGMTFLELFIVFLFTLFITAPVDIYKDQKQSIVSRDSQIEQQQKTIVEYGSEERLANGESLELGKSNIDGISIEVFNGEKRNPFSGKIILTGITGRTLPNPIELYVGNSGERIFHLSPLSPASMRLIYLNGEDAIISTGDMNSFRFNEPSEEVITTLLVGDFSSPPQHVVRQDQWKFTVTRNDNGKNIFDLELMPKG